VTDGLFVNLLDLFFSHGIEALLYDIFHLSNESLSESLTEEGIAGTEG
jgi:hypothetical protein